MKKLDERIGKALACYLAPRLIRFAKIMTAGGD